MLDGLLKVLDHIRCGGRGMRHILRGVYDALRNVGRVYDRPLGRSCAGAKKQAQGDNGNEKFELLHLGFG